MVKPSYILIQGARVHNLKNVSCQLPHQQFTVITGPSGSGKSSLAFDTLFAEGQRRYIESMSAYARQFLARMEKPDVDHIQHLLPAIALEQKNGVKNARSTVGSATEINDFLRFLFVAAGTMRCQQCQQPVQLNNPQQIQTQLQSLPVGSKLILLAPVKHSVQMQAQLLQNGFFRFYHNKAILDINDHQAVLQGLDCVDIVIDRFVLKDKPMAQRLRESIRNALALSQGVLDVVFPETGERQRFQNQYACQSCHQVYDTPSPHWFSFNNPLGACPVCEGYGRVIGLDLDKVIPNRALSLQQGAVHPFSRPAYQEVYGQLMEEAGKRNIPTDIAWQALSDEAKQFVIEGGGDYEGIRRFFEWMESKKYKVQVRVMLAKYRGYYLCAGCQGARLRPEALTVYIEQHNFSSLGNTPIAAVLSFFRELSITGGQDIAIQRLLEEIISRLSCLVEMGLGYLTLNRQFRTLSNGEAQRINLASALGSRLTDTLYVMDEPTVGLHARDTDRLLGILKSLCDQGNTVVVVEHDPEVMLAADYIIDMGPSGGHEGGHIVYEGTPEQLLRVSYSVTATWLSNPLFNGSGQQALERMPFATLEKRLLKTNPTGNWFEIQGAEGNNLKNITVRFPKASLVCVVGVSGSGKSTLIKQTLFTACEHSEARSLELEALPYRGINGLEEFRSVVLVDQTPLGRSARSNPVTYIKAYDEIRKLFAATRKAMSLGITAGHFSFNTPGGRCETCEGLGTLTIDMQFMADVTMQCHDCHGRRFNASVLTIDLNGMTIDQVLNMTIKEAIPFFSFSAKTQQKLMALDAIGLGYIQLGQSTSTLSGGETQRLKLASYLAEKPARLPNSNQPVLFLFDEPTKGLHMSDIQLLLKAFRNLIATGHSVVVIEHHIDFIAQSDYLIELGPEGGNLGGEIVCLGSPEQVMLNADSPTGKYLHKRYHSTALPVLCHTDKSKIKM
jgi:excinuclease ABC subunit A